MNSFQDYLEILLEDNEDDNFDYVNLYDEYIENELFISENSTTKYNIVLCELYNPNLHGFTNTQVNSHFIVIEKFKRLNISYINLFSNAYYYYYYSNLNKNHQIFRNYEYIISRENYLQPEIAQCIYLPDGECICILKTFWIKLIQRTWKNIYAKKKILLNLRKNPNNIKYKEIYGNWHFSCCKIPSLQGMLNYLTY